MILETPMNAQRISVICTLLFAMALLVGCSEEGPMVPPVNGIDHSSTATGNQAILKSPGDDQAEMDVNNGMVPFRGTYTTVVAEAGFVPPSTVLLDIWGEGYATHLGKSTWYSLSSADITTGEQWGSTVEIAANGDEFHYDYLGGSGVDDVTGLTTFWGDWTVTGGTGRFTGATGGGTYEGTADGTQGTGQITLVGEISRPNRYRLMMD
jgi:hypothetical protein